MTLLQEELKKYSWQKPGRCPCCGNRRLWGHGYVDRCFDNYLRALPLKRYRCVRCTAVHTMRPEGYLPRISSPKSVLFASISGRLRKQKWMASISRQRQQYWYRGFVKQAAIVSLGKDLQVFLEESHKRGYPYVSHSINNTVTSAVWELPHLSFAVTAHDRPP